jgi:hypothetical protein
MDILALIDAEIANLQAAKALILKADQPERKRAGRPKATAGPPLKRRRQMSPEGKARIAEAAKRRWAAVAAEKKSAAKK